MSLHVVFVANHDRDDVPDPYLVAAFRTRSTADDLAKKLAALGLDATAETVYEPAEVTAPTAQTWLTSLLLSWLHAAGATPVFRAGAVWKSAGATEPLARLHEDGWRLTPAGVRDLIDYGGAGTALDPGLIDALQEAYDL